MNNSLAPTLLPPTHGTVFHAFGEQLTIKLGTAETNGSFALCSELTPPGGGPPLHFHLHEDELFVVQEGRVSFCIDRTWTELKPGGVAFVPRGAIHTFRNTGDLPCRQWVLTTPAGFEVFFARCAAEFAKPDGPDMARIMAISAEHGIHLVADQADVVPVLPARAAAPG